MKRFILFLSALTIFVPKINTVNAEQNLYARILSYETGIYKDADEDSLMFYLPYSYYVKVLSYDTPYSHIECYGTGDQPSIDGYVLTSELTFDDASPKSPYLKQKVTNVETTALYSSYKSLDTTCFIPKSRSLYYYGYVTSGGGTYYLVSYLNKLGYVKEEDIAVFTFTLHENPIIDDKATAEETTTVSDETPTDKRDNTIKAAIIVCLSFAVLIVLFSFFKGKEKPPQEE